ncbi:MAG: hypothetical protein ONB44_13910 [candidate division KSB1 bacterium]|nr:hypothetical protein [candidate division KSB1 bacterium]MDZ7303219.1 hypothetical protein [candidate division KSB1 bacterium]MDZ7312169.1 hypothetical protein [candidate division KSB1 bacterium]
MKEANVYIIKGGINFCLDVRVAELRSQDNSPDLFEKACSALSRRHGLPAVKIVNSERRKLLVFSKHPIPYLELRGDNWLAEIIDSGECQRLSFSDRVHRDTLAQLVERMILIAVRKRGDLWKLESNRIWYESQPFNEFEDISAFRRYHFSVVPIDGVGLGLAVHVSTAFFTNWTVADYFRNGTVSSDKGKRERFEYLSQRQKGQKGTLLYNTGKSKHKCYFEEYLDGVTCETTGRIPVKGKTFSSLFDYYQSIRSPFSKHDAVARVSFKGIDRPVIVAARALRLRVMNDALPNSLKQIDKIAPKERRQLIEGFLAELTKSSYLNGKLNIEHHPWRPDTKKCQEIALPSLLFAGGKRLEAPTNPGIQEYRNYYRQRLSLLTEVGCYHVPITMNKYIKVVVPQHIDEKAQHRLATDIESRFVRWTKKSCEVEIVTYATIEEAVTKLHKYPSPGLAIIVFDNDDPATYYNLAYELNSWRIKRITSSELKKKYNVLVNDESRAKDKNGKIPKGVQSWQSFIDLNALDGLQQLGCVPWTIATELNYEGHLVIDVSEDRRHFALSLLLCRRQGNNPPFWIDTIVPRKPDHKKETINAELLRDEILNLFNRIAVKNFVPLDSLLALRDGRECGDEINGIRTAQQILIERGYLRQDAKVDIVDFHKKSVKNIRFWHLIDSQTAENTLEATALYLKQKIAVLANTGAATLHQGTADPIMLVAHDEKTDLTAVVKDVAATAQLNFSNPRVAQRLPLPFKRTDDELKNRAAQEIRRIK